MGKLREPLHDQGPASAGQNDLWIKNIHGTLRRVSVGNQTSVCDIRAVYLHKAGGGENATADRIIPEVLAVPIRFYVSENLELALDGFWDLHADLRGCTLADVIELVALVEH